MFSNEHFLYTIFRGNPKKVGKKVGKKVDKGLTQGPHEVTVKAVIGREVGELLEWLPHIYNASLKS